MFHIWPPCACITIIGHFDHWLMAPSIKSWLIVFFLVSRLPSNRCHEFVGDIYQLLQRSPDCVARTVGQSLTGFNKIKNILFQKSNCVSGPWDSDVARNFRHGVRQSVAFVSVHSRSAALPCRPYNQKTSWHIISPEWLNEQWYTVSGQLFFWNRMFLISLNPVVQVEARLSLIDKNIGTSARFYA